MPDFFYGNHRDDELCHPGLADRARGLEKSCFGLIMRLRPAPYLHSQVPRYVKQASVCRGIVVPFSEYQLESFISQRWFESLRITDKLSTGQVDVTRFEQHFDGTNNGPTFYEKKITSEELPIFPALVKIAEYPIQDRTRVSRDWLPIKFYVVPGVEMFASVGWRFIQQHFRTPFPPEIVVGRNLKKQNYRALKLVAKLSNFCDDRPERRALAKTS